MASKECKHKKSETKKEKQRQSTYFEQATFWLDKAHPNWKVILDAEFGEAETVCIPDCLDIRPQKFFGPTKPAAGFSKEEVKKAKSRLKCEKGEEDFLKEFRKLKLGGILIHGFDSQHFNKVMRENSVKFFGADKNDEKHFDCDFIFIHQRFGVAVIEVKGCHHENEIPSQFRKATGQLKRTIFGLENLYKLISGGSICKFDIQSAVCMPSFILTKMRNQVQEQKLRLNLIDKTILHNAENFKVFWKLNFRRAFKLTEASIKFFAALITYRSAMFISAACNSLAVYHRIEKQDFCNRKSKGSQLIFFNEEQLNAINCIDQRLAIYGLPGTGKTLCLIQRALNASKIDKPGRVILAFFNAHGLFPLFEEIFKKYKCDDMKRVPQVKFAASFDIKYYSPDDDLFCDEIDKCAQELLSARKLEWGSTTIVITGYLKPSSVPDVAPNSANFKYCKLTTVVRGTKTIVREWKHHFPAESNLRLGHNITGAPIERYPVSGRSGMLKKLQEKIAALLRPVPTTKKGRREEINDDQSNLQLQCTPRDIVVLTVSNGNIPVPIHDFTCIRNYFKENGIHSGLIVEQVKKPELIALDSASYAMSYEWPIVIVIVIKYQDGETSYMREPEYLIATSRAIAKLIIIERTLDDDEIEQLNYEIMISGRSYGQKRTAANDCKNQKSKSKKEKRGQATFFEEAILWLEKAHPNWKVILDAEFGEAETICIPDCLDILPQKFLGPTKPAAGFNMEEVKKAKSRLKGEKGEEDFLRKFRKLKLGGILIHGFDSRHFNKVMCENSVKFFGAEKNEEQHFECDFIFIHKRCGFIVVEVKGCNRENEMPGQFRKAAGQLKRQIVGLENIYKLISGNATCTLDIQSVICMPSFIFATKRKRWWKKFFLKEELKLHLIGKTMLHNAQNFLKFCKFNFHRAFKLTEASTKFFAALISYRSAMFISAACNSLAVHHRIHKQEFKGRKRNESELAFFNEEQLEAINYPEQRLAIYGLPGTGKTLCLIQRVLNASKIDKPGRVILAIINAYDLLPLFEEIFEKFKCDDMKRIPQVTFAVSFDMKYYSPDDDLFCDEIDKYTLKFLSARKLESGSTTMVITGYLKPSSDAPDTEEKTAREKFKYCELTTVVRGTKTIVEEWMSHFPTKSRLRLGHNITGAPIERYSVSGRTEMLKKLQEKIIALLRPLPKTETGSREQMDDESNRLLRCTPRDIVVLTVSNRNIPVPIHDFTCIRNYFQENDIQCSLIVEQGKKPELIALDSASFAMSYEWPIVIIIAITYPNRETSYMTDPEYVIAASRAIGKLIVIDRTLDDSELESQRH